MTVLKIAQQKSGGLIQTIKFYSLRVMLILGCLAYNGCLYLFLSSAYGSHTPCKEDFEGGCSYEKSLAYLSVLFSPLTVVMGNGLVVLFKSFLK
jgi:hypothetical protein